MQVTFRRKDIRDTVKRITHKIRDELWKMITAMRDDKRDSLDCPLQENSYRWTIAIWTEVNNEMYSFAKVIMIANEMPSWRKLASSRERKGKHKTESFSSSNKAPFRTSSQKFSCKSQLRFSSFPRLFSGAFRLYDVDNDGFITRDEMYNIVDAIYQMVVSVSLSTYLEETYDIWNIFHCSSILLVFLPSNPFNLFKIALTYLWTTNFWSCY